MMWKKQVAISLLLSLALVGCATGDSTLNLEGAKFAVVATDSTRADSELTLLDAAGTETDSVRIAAQGVFQIFQPSPTELVLPAQSSSQITRVADNQVETTPSRFHPYHFIRYQDKEVILYNSDEQDNMYYWTYEFYRAGEVTKLIRQKGFPAAILTDRQYAYLFLDDVETSHHSLLILDLEAESIVKEVPIAEGGAAGSMLLDDNRLLIAGTKDGKADRAGKNLIVVDVDGSYGVRTVPLKHTAPHTILRYQEQLLVTHKLDGRHLMTVLDRKTLQEVRTLEFPHPLFKVQVDGDSLFVLHQKGHGGKITEYALGTFEKKREFAVEGKRKTLVQNFMVLK